MRFYNRQHRHYCGIDRHVKAMYVCLLDSAGQVLVHRNVKATAEAFLEIVAPYREDLVVAAEDGLLDGEVSRGVVGKGAGEPHVSLEPLGTELVSDRDHACAAKRHEPTIMSHRSGSEQLGWDARSLPRYAHAFTGWAAPPRSLVTMNALGGDVARHEEAGMRARMSF
jgi:hypothetical protein